jgi:hypothetical protein
MTYRKSNNGGTDTGLWTYSLGTLSGFTVGAVYLARVSNSGAFPTDQMREFQYGSAEGDLVTTANGTGVGELNVVLADGVAHGGTPGSSTATMALKQLNLTNSAGTALVASSTGGNGTGAAFTGNGTGQAASFTGGSTAATTAVKITGGSTTSNGLVISGGSFGTSVQLIGNTSLALSGTGSGLQSNKG